MLSCQKVGDAAVQCPECFEVIYVPVYAELVQEADGGQSMVTDSDASALWAHYETHAFETSTDAAAIERAADWLEAQREHMWNGNERRPNNYKRAAGDLRRYAAEVRKKAADAS